jgi:hypothetical protein
VHLYTAVRNIPVPLQLRREAGWLVSASCGRTSPENLVDFVFPWNFPSIHLDQRLLVKVPTIGIIDGFDFDMSRW